MVKLGATAITESEFYDQLTDDHVKVVDMGCSALHSDGSTVLYECSSGKYAQIVNV